jgi:hypothetical protein
METIAPVLDLRSYAASIRAKFSDGQRMRINRSKVVHAVDRERWVAGELIPQPLCHTGSYGWNESHYNPVRRPVSCAKCRMRMASADEVLLGYGEYQPPLFRLPARAA